MQNRNFRNYELSRIVRAVRQCDKRNFHRNNVRGSTTLSGHDRIGDVVEGAINESYNHYDEGKYSWMLSPKRIMIRLSHQGYVRRMQKLKWMLLGLQPQELVEFNNHIEDIYRGQYRLSDDTKRFLRHLRSNVKTTTEEYEHVNRLVDVIKRYPDLTINVWIKLIDTTRDDALSYQRVNGYTVAIKNVNAYIDPTIRCIYHKDCHDTTVQETQKPMQRSFIDDCR